MSREFDSIIDLLNQYEVSLTSNNALDLDFEMILSLLKNYFPTPVVEEEKLQQGKIIEEKIKKIVALMNVEMQLIKQNSLNQTNTWEKQKKYMETLQFIK